MAKTKKNMDKNIKFSLSIGDEGAILVCLNGSEIIKRIFVTSPTSTEFINFLSAYPNAPLYLIVDVVEQAYIKHTLPPVSRINVNKLVARKLEKDFDKNDIKAAIPMEKEKGQRKEWNWLFISVRNIPPFSDWIESVSNLPNYFAGIYLLPIESMNYLKDIEKALSHEDKEVVKEKPQKKEKGKKAKKEKKEKKLGKKSHGSRWQIIVSHNRVGGFRQIVFKDGKVIFTRMAQPIGGQSPDIIAGNIEQETLNTIEYIRRLGYEDNEGLKIIIIASGDVKEALETIPQTGVDQRVFTPYEIAVLLDISSVAEESDRFGDVVLASHFLSSKKHVLPLFTKYTEKINSIIKYKKIVRIATVLAAIGALGFSGFTYYQTININDSLEESNNKKKITQSSLAKTKSKKLEFDEDPKLVKVVSDINNKLAKDSNVPLTYLSKIASLKGFNTYFDEINLQIDLFDDRLDVITSSFSVMFFEQDQADRTVDTANFQQAIEKIFPSEGCGLSCYQLNWEGLLEFQEVSIMVKEKESLYSNSDMTRVDLNITGPQKETQRARHIIRRR